MFQEEILSTKHILMEMLEQEGTTSFFKRVHEHPDLHLFYKHFFLSVEHQWTDALVMPMRENTFFSFDNTPLNFLRETIHATLFEHAVIPQSTLDKLCTSAVEARYNFLIRPRVTLKWFVFGDKPLRSLQYIRNRVQGLSGYEYLTDGIVAMLSESDTVPQEQIISVIDFTRAVAKVEQEYLLHLHADEFVALFNPLFELFGEVYRDDNDEPFEGIPTPAVIIFLDEKHIPGFSEYFEELLNDPVTPKKFITRDDIYIAIEKVVPPSIQDGFASADNDSDTMNTDVNSNIISLTQNFSREESSSKNSNEVIVDVDLISHKVDDIEQDMAKHTFLDGKSNILGIIPIDEEDN